MKKHNMEVQTVKQTNEEDVAQLVEHQTSTHCWGRFDSQVRQETFLLGCFVQGQGQSEGS